MDNIIQEIIDNRKKIIEDMGIKVIKEEELKDLIQGEFEFNISSKKFNIVLQVGSPLLIADIQDLYLDFIKDRIKKRDLIKEIDNLEILVNQPSLLKDLINNKSSEMLENLTIKEKGKVIDNISNIFVYFCTFCTPLFEQN